MTASVLDGNGAATVAGTVMITIPAGRTWYGTFTVGALIAVGQQVWFTTAGVGAVPAAAGIYHLCANITAAGVAAADPSEPFYAVAPAGNSITIVAMSNAAGAGVLCHFNGVLM